MPQEYYETYLIHYGKKGMKWGSRHDESGRKTAIYAYRVNRNLLKREAREEKKDKPRGAELRTFVPEKIKRSQFKNMDTEVIQRRAEQVIKKNSHLTEHDILKTPEQAARARRIVRNLKIFSGLTTAALAGLTVASLKSDYN